MLCEQLRKAGWRAWIVGGCLRDLLLDREVHDWDIATDARPEHVRGIFRRVVPTGIRHGTVTVMIGSIGYEITTLRGEGSYSDGRHPDSVTFVDDLTEDLERRDFTMNAIAFDPLAAKLFDPFDGCVDLRARCIRAVGDPNRRFREDGLRVMRAARFCATLAFDIEPHTSCAMADALGTLRMVSQERVRDELLKTLGAPVPSRGLEVLRATGAIDVVLPELVPTIGCDQNHYHAFDVWTHTMRCVDACRTDSMLRLALLLHDVGKPEVRAISDKTSDFTFYGHEVISARIADRICERLRLSTDQRRVVVDVVRHHLIPYDSGWSDAAVRRWIRKVGLERAPDLLEVARADTRGKGVDASATLRGLDELEVRVQRLQQQGAAFCVRDLAVGGRDIMQELGLAPGRLVGQVLAHLLELVMDEPQRNERAQLLDAARVWLATHDLPDN
jgi:tRNA nucleotidyltransferase (CCA-adding enzyme)